MPNSDNKKPWLDTIKWEYESARKREKMYKQTLKKFAADEGIQHYLSQFRGAESAVQSYAWQKARWMVDKDQVEWCLDYNVFVFIITQLSSNTFVFAI